MSGNAGNAGSKDGIDGMSHHRFGAFKSQLSSHGIQPQVGEAGADQANASIRMYRTTVMYGQIIMKTRSRSTDTG